MLTCKDFAVLSRYAAIYALAIGFLMGAHGVSQAEPFSNDDIIMIQAAPGVIHFDSSPEHVRYSWMIGVEWQPPNYWLAGYAYFNNSFGQKSHYVYGGRLWILDSVSPNLYVKVTAGVILGYKEPHENAIPFNNDGVGLGVIPAIGYKYERFNLQLNLLGKAGIAFTAGYDLPY